LLLPDLEGKYSLQIQTSTACNAACIFCPHRHTWGKAPVHRMPDALLERVLAQMKPFVYYKIAPYLQNDPFCDERIFSVIRRIREEFRFDILELSANPISLDPSLFAALTESLQGVPHEIRLSFHGVDKAGFEKNMGLDFDRSLHNALSLLHAASENRLCVTVKALGAGKGGASFAAEFSEDDFLRFWTDQCAREGLDPAQFQWKYSRYHSRSGNAQRSGAQWTFGGGEVVRPDLRGFCCSRADKWFHVLSTGELILCCNDYGREVVIGDLSKTGIRQILASARYRTVRDQVQGFADAPPNFICKRCTSPGG
jgi:hypothetical protein